MSEAPSTPARSSPPSSPHPEATPEHTAATPEHTAATPEHTPATPQPPSLAPSSPQHHMEDLPEVHKRFIEKNFR